MRSLVRKTLSLLLCICLIGTNLLIPGIVDAATTGEIFTTGPNPYYSVGQTFGIKVVDADLNTTSGSAVEVMVESTQSGSIPVTLWRDSNDPTCFVGNVKISDQNSTTTIPQIKAANGDTITATYQDASNSSGNPEAISTFITVADQVPAPQANVDSQNNTFTLFCNSTGAAIYYTTDGSEPRRPDADPNNHSSLYDGRSFSTSSATIVKAFAVEDAKADSATATFAYNVIPVHVTNPGGGIPAQGTRVDLYDQYGGYRKSANTDSTGMAYIDPTGLEQGDYVARAYPADSSSLSVSDGMTVSIAADDTYKEGNIEAQLNNPMYVWPVQKPDIKNPGSYLNAGGAWVDINMYNDPNDPNNASRLFGVPVQQDGRFFLPPLQDGRYRISANPSQTDTDYVRSYDMDITVSNNALTTTPAALVLNVAQVSGTVTYPFDKDSDGKNDLVRGENYNIRVRSTNSSIGDNIRYVWSNWDSTYKIGGLQPGEYEVLAESKDPSCTSSFGSVFTISADGKSSASVADLQLTDPQVTGIVQLPTDPVSNSDGGRVEIYDATGKNYISDVQVNSDGSFKIGGLTAGSYMLKASSNYREYIDSDLQQVTIGTTPTSVTLLLNMRKLLFTGMGPYEKGSDELWVNVKYSDVLNDQFGGLTAEIRQNSTSIATLPFKELKGYGGPESNADIIFSVNSGVSLEYGDYTLTLKNGTNTVGSQTFSVIQGLNITPYIVPLSGYQTNGITLNINARDMNGVPQTPVWSTGTVTVKVTNYTTTGQYEEYNGTVDAAVNTPTSITIGAKSAAQPGNRTVEVFQNGKLIARGGFDVGDAVIRDVYAKESSNEVILSGDYLNNYMNMNATAELWNGSNLVAVTSDKDCWGELAFRFNNITIQAGIDYTLKIYSGSTVVEKTFRAIPRLDIADPIVSTVSGDRNLVIDEGSNSGLWAANDNLTVFINSKDQNNDVHLAVGTLDGLTVDASAVNVQLPENMQTGEYNIDVVRGETRVGFAEFFVNTQDNVIVGTVSNPDNSATDGGYVNINKKDTWNWGQRATIGHDGKFYIPKSELNKGDGTYEFIAVPLKTSRYASNSSKLEMKNGGIASNVSISLLSVQIKGTVTAGTGKAARGRVDVSAIDQNGDWKWIFGVDIDSDGTYKLGGLLPDKKYMINANPADEDDFFSSDGQQVIYTSTDAADKTEKTVDLAFTIPQFKGYAFDVNNARLKGDQYEVGVRSIGFDDRDIGCKKRDTYFIIGKLDKGIAYGITIVPKANSSCARSEEAVIKIDDTGASDRNDLSFSATNPQLNGIVKDSTNSDLTNGYVEIYKGTLANLQYVGWVPVYQGSFKLGGFANGNYYIRAFADKNDNQSITDAPSVYTPITIGTTDNITLKLTDSAVPRVQMTKNITQWSDTLELRLSNLAKADISKFQAAIQKYNETSHEYDTLFTISQLSTGWVNDYTGDGDLQIRSQDISKLQLGTYKVVLTYNGNPVAIENAGGNIFKVVKWLKLNPYVIKLGETPDKTFEISVEKGDTAPWGSTDTLTVKLYSDQGTEYTLPPCAIDSATNVINASLLSQPLTEGGYSVKVYKGTELIGMSYLKVGNPYIRAAYNFSEDDGSILVCGDYLEYYNGAKIVANVYQGTSTTPVLTSTDVFTDRDCLNVKMGDKRLAVGEYRLELIIDGVPATMEKNTFRVIDLLYSDPGYLFLPNTSGSAITLNTIDNSRTPWAVGDNLSLNIQNEDIGKGYVVKGITATTTSAITFQWPGELSDVGRHSIVVLNENDPDNPKSVGYAPIDIIGTAQLKGLIQIKDSINTPVPYAQIFVNTKDWGRTFTADKDGKYAVYGLNPGEYNVRAAAPIGTQYIEDYLGEMLKIGQDGSSNISDYNFKLIPAKAISGTISLPGSEVAPADGVNVWVSAWSDNGTPENKEDDFQNGRGVYIPANQHSADFSVFVPGNDSYTVQAWSDGPGLVNTAVYYSTTGSAITMAEASKVSVSDANVSGINFALVKGNEISGTFTLPDGTVVPAEGMRVFISIVNDNGTEDGMDDIYAGTEVEIQPGVNAGSFKMNVPAKAGYVVGYEYYQSDSILDQGFYYKDTLSEATIFNRDAASRLDLSQAGVSSVDMTFIPAKVITGKITLPAPATKDLYDGVVVAWNDAGTEIETDDSFFNDTVEIDAGESSYSYKIKVPLANNYRVLTDVRDSGLVSGATLYGGAKGSVFTATDAAVLDLRQNNASNIDIALVGGRTISGTVSIPTAVTEDRIIKIHAFVDYGTKTTYDDIDAGIKIVIKAGQTTASYSMVVPAAAAYKVEYISDPAYGYEDVGFYSANGTVFDYNSAAKLDLSANGQTGINLNVSNRLSPQIVGAQVVPDGNMVKLFFSKGLDLKTIPSASTGFSVKVGTDTYTVVGVAPGQNPNEINLMLDGTYKIFKDYTGIKVAYDGSAGIKSLDGMLLGDFVKDVANNSARTVAIVTGFADGALLNKDATVKVTTSGENINIKENGNTLVSNATTAGYVFQDNGTHTITVSVAGRKNDTVLTFTIDKVAPVVSITGATNAINNHNGVTPVVTISGTNGVDYMLVSKVVTLNGQAYDGSTITKAGKYTITASVKDKAGNIGSATANFEVIWDTSAPKITVTGVENGKTYDAASTTAAAISVDLTSALTTNSNLSNYYYKGTLQKPDGSVTVFDKNSIPAITAEGKYRLEILAVNPSYTDITNSTVVEFTVDNAAPAASITNVTEGKTYNTSVTPVVNFTDSIASQQILLANAKVTLTKDGVAIPYNAGNTITEDGSYRLEVSTKDAFGHSSNIAAVTFKIDKVKPVITISGAFNGYTYKDQDVPVTIKTNEGTLTVTNNGAPVTLDSNGQVIFKADANTTAVVNLVVKAVDNAENATEQQLTFTIDRLAVNIVVNGVANGSLLNSNPVIRFTTYEGSVEKTGTTAKIDDVAFTSGTTYSLEGTHTLVLSYTSGGNTYTKSIGFTIDKTAPTVTNIGIQKNGSPVSSAIYAKTGDSIKVKADISEANGINEVYFSLGAAAAAVPMKYNQAGYYEGEFIVGSGSYPAADITVTAKDKAGNSVLQKGTAQATVDNTKPTVSAETDPLIADGKNGIFIKNDMKITLTAGETDTIQYSFNNISGNGTGSVVLSTPKQGANILVYKAVDLAGNVSDEKVLMFNYDNIQPANVTLTTSIPTTPVNTQTIALSGTVTGEGGSTGSRILLKKGTAVIASANIKANSSFTIDGIRLAEGQNSFTLTAVDLAGNESPVPTVCEITLDSIAPIISVEKQDDTHYTVKVNEDATTPVVKFNGTIITDPSKIVAVTPAGIEVVAQYTVETPAPIEGTNVINVFATDIAGNIGSGSYSSTFIPASGQNDVQLSDNSSMDIPGGAFNSSVQMLVKTTDTTTDSTSYKPLGATVSFEFVDDQHQTVKPSQTAPLVIRNFIGMGLTGVALMHVTDQGVVDKTITATVKTSSEFNMNDSTAINNLGTFDKDGVVIYVSDTGYLVFKTSTFSGYAAVQDVTAPVISLTTTVTEINNLAKSAGLMSIAGNLYTDSSKQAADTTATITEVDVDGTAMDLSSIDATLKDNTFNIPLDLSDGTHDVTIKAADGAGNTSTLTKTYTVDTTIPHITVTVPVTKTNDSTIDVTVTTSEPAEIFINHTSMGTYSGTSVIPYELMDGTTNLIDVAAYDALGNWMMDVKSVTRDSVAPVIAVSGISNNGIYGSGRSITVTVTDSMDANPVKSVKIDGTTYDPDPDTVYSIEGQHTLRVEATDSFGNTSTSEVIFTIDTSVPNVTLSGVSNGEVYNTAKGLTITVANADELIVTKSTDGQTPEIVAMNTTGGAITLGTANEKHTYTISVTARKLSGNQLTATDSISLTVDMKAPVITSTTETTTANTSVNITGTVDETADIYVNGSKVIAGNVAGNFTTPAQNLTLGNNSFSVKAVDLAGNETSISVTVNRVVPEVILSGVDNGGVYNTTKNLTITTENADQLTVTKSVDGQTPEIVVMNTSGGAITLGVANERHTYTITATVQKQTATATDSITVTVDMKAPSITSTTATKTEAASIDITGSVDEIADIYLDGNKVISGNAAGNFTIPVQNLTVGSHSYSLKAVDLAGNETSITVTVERTQPVTPPVIVIIPPVIVTPGPESGVITAKPVLTGDKAKATTTADDLDAAFKQVTANAAGIKTISIQVQEVEGAKGYSQELPASAVQSANQSITIQTPIASVTVPGNMFAASELANKAAIEISVAPVDASTLGKDIAKAVGNKPIIDISAAIDGKAVAWNNPNAPVTITIDYTPTKEELKKPDHIVVWYVDGSGRMISVPSGRYNPATGKVTFTTTHFSKYAIGFAEKTFNDITNYGWAKNAIEVLASKGIIGGTSETTFAPGVNITRADFMVLLVKALGLTAKVDANFSDVKASDYYYEAVGIAKKLGITTGSGNNLFRPQDYITRQDMMVLVNKALQLQNKLSNPGTAATLSRFTDTGNIADYAVQSVANLVKESIVAGSGDKVNPRGYATRAEIAVIVYKLYNK